MTKINEMKRTGTISKEVVSYEIFKMGNASFIVKRNRKPVECVFSSEDACTEYINCIPEF